MRTAVFINYSSNNNSGKKKWQRIREKVVKELPAGTIFIPFEVPFNLKDCLQKLILDEKVSCIISAGGDGTLNHILNTLHEIKGGDSRKFCLGGIGLGSSNDFLKPYHRWIGGIPVMISLKDPKLCDIGQVKYTNEHSQQVTRLFIINASLGITADANLLFNRGDLIIRLTKSRFVGFAITYTAFRTLLTYRNKELKVKENGKFRNLRAANISITKSPYISGSFRYDSCPPEDSGELGFHCSGDMSKLEIIKTLRDLSRGVYSGSKKRNTEFVKKLEIKADQLVALETDGEVQLGREFSFTVIPRSICLAS